MCVPNVWLSETVPKNWRASYLALSVLPVFVVKFVADTPTGKFSTVNLVNLPELSQAWNIGLKFAPRKTVKTGAALAVGSVVGKLIPWTVRFGAIVSRTVKFTVTSSVEPSG